MSLSFTVDKANILQVVARFLSANKCAVLNIAAGLDSTDFGASLSVDLGYGKLFSYL
jgi:hypothetical protein